MSVVRLLGSREQRYMKAINKKKKKKKKSGTNLTGSFLKQYPNTEKIRSNADFNWTTQNACKLFLLSCSNYVSVIFNRSCLNCTLFLTAQSHNYNYTVMVRYSRPCVRLQCLVWFCSFVVTTTCIVPFLATRLIGIPQYTGVSGKMWRSWRTGAQGGGCEGIGGGALDLTAGENR